MIRSLHLALLVALAGLLVACGEPTLDATDLEDSIVDMRASLDVDEHGDFDYAIGLVRRASTGEIDGTPAFELDGMTASQVFEEAKSIETRRDLAWAEEIVEQERKALAVRDDLALLSIPRLELRWNGNALMASLDIHNGLEEAVESAWLRLGVERADRDAIEGEDMIPFQPRLEPGETRTIHFQVTSDVRRAEPTDTEATLTSRFTLIEGGGEIILQDLSPEQRAAARERLAEAERQRDELRARLQP